MVLAPWSDEGAEGVVPLRRGCRRKGAASRAPRPSQSDDYPVASNPRTTRSPTESRARSVASSEQMSCSVRAARSTYTASASSQAWIRAAAVSSASVAAST